MDANHLWVKNGCVNGRQRYRCRICGISNSKRKSDRRDTITENQEHIINAGISRGLSARAIAAKATVSVNTVYARLRAVQPVPLLHLPVNSPAENECEYCGATIMGRRRKGGRTKRKFCNGDCFQKFYLVNDEVRLSKTLLKTLERKGANGRKKTCHVDK